MSQTLSIREEPRPARPRCCRCMRRLRRNSRGRLVPEPDDPLRTCFQRDRDRIIHSKRFRRLMHMTQVFPVAAWRPLSHAHDAHA